MILFWILGVHGRRTLLWFEIYPLDTSSEGLIFLKMPNMEVLYPYYVKNHMKAMLHWQMCGCKHVLGIDVFRGPPCTTSRWTTLTIFMLERNGSHFSKWPPCESNIEEYLRQSSNGTSFHHVWGIILKKIKCSTRWYYILMGANLLNNMGAMNMNFHIFSQNFELR